MAENTSCKSCTEVEIRRDKRFVCVEYPGIVRNVNKMLETLGGIETISKTYSDPSSRLPLRFRPDNVFCKQAYGDRLNTTRLLLKVRRRRHKTGPGTFDTTYHSEVLGFVEETYRFRSMMDFQYLPMESTSSGTCTSLIPKLVPSKLESSSWIEIEVPLVLPPIFFSRIDNPSDYYFRPMTISKNEETNRTDTPSHLIASIRKKRFAFVVYHGFNDGPVPTEPLPGSVVSLKMKHCPSDIIARIRHAFEWKPIWSKNGLAANLCIQKCFLSSVLPTIAYRFSTGPWRQLWVKFGYDPRKNATAKKDQILDFRMKRGKGKQLGNQSRSPARIRFPSKFVNQSMQVKPVTIQIDVLEEPMPGTSSSETVTKKMEELECYTKFRRGVMPPQRQMYYQLSDILIEKVQDMLHENDGQETTCDERDGWCTTNFIERCREIMNEVVMESYSDIQNKTTTERPEEKNKEEYYDDDDSD